MLAVTPTICYHKVHWRHNVSKEKMFPFGNIYHKNKMICSKFMSQKTELFPQKKKDELIFT